MVWFGTMGAVHGSVMFGLELKGCKNDGVVWNYIGAVRGSRSCEALGAYLNTPTNSYAQTPHNKLNLRIYYFCICTREYTVQCIPQFTKQKPYAQSTILHIPTRATNEQVTFFSSTAESICRYKKKLQFNNGQITSNNMTTGLQ